MEDGKRRIVYADNVRGEVTIPIKSEYLMQFTEILLKSGYSVKIKDDGDETEVTIRRD